MWIDKNLVLCEDTEFFGAANTSMLIGDIIDLGQFDSGKPTLSNGSPAVDNIGDQPNFGGVLPMTLMFRITESMAGGQNVNFKLWSDDELVTGTLSGGDDVHWESGIIGRAEVVEGLEIIVPLGSNNKEPYKRYLQMGLARVGDSTAGKCSAWLVYGAPQWQPLRANYVKQV